MKIRKVGNQAVVLVPKEVMDYMGWEIGDDVVCQQADNKTNKIIFIKINRGDSNDKSRNKRRIPQQ